MPNAARMGKIIFGGKQFFLGTLRLTRDWLAAFGLTPARFNMLCAIASGRSGVAQHQLRSLLGVSTPTICRMLRSLEELRFIVRTPHPRNSRHRWVALTTAGAFRLHGALTEVADGAEYRWSIGEMLNPEPGVIATGERALREADAMFTRSRGFLQDIATLEFAYF